MGTPFTCFNACRDCGDDTQWTKTLFFRHFFLKIILFQRVVNIYRQKKIINSLILQCKFIVNKKQVYIFQYKYVYTIIGARLRGKLKICIDNASPQRGYCIALYKYHLIYMELFWKKSGSLSTKYLIKIGFPLILDTKVLTNTYAFELINLNIAHSSPYSIISLKIQCQFQWFRQKTTTTSQL